MATFDTNVTAPSNPIIASLAGETRYTPGQTLDYFFGNSFSDFFEVDPLAFIGLTGTLVNFSFGDELEAAFDAVSNITNINFSRTFIQDNSDLSYYSVDNLADPSSGGGSIILGFHTFPGDITLGADGVAVSFYNSNTPSLTASAEIGGGNLATFTAIHEVGHGMGLGHSSDNGNGTLQAISGTVLDDPRYTVMVAFAAGANNFGQAVSYMALDIAALQHLYGVDTTTYTGATIYALTDPRTTALDVDGNDGTISIGRAYYSIWDAAGEDEINYDGSDRALINLNDATLVSSLDPVDDADLIELLAEVQASDAFNTLSNTVQTEMTESNRTAGGFFSQVLDPNGNAIDGGFTIANGAVIENANGSGGNDVLIGNEANNILTGNGGNDALFGGAGSDTLLGGSGVDTLYGGSGADTLNGGGGNDTINGGAGADMIDGGDGQGTDTVNGGAGNDIINGRNGVDILSGGADNDTISGQNKNDVLMGDGGEDTLNGNQGNDTLLGGDDNDMLFGGASADTLNGQDGDDDLFGGGQADVLNGGRGMDELDGGSGNDSLSGGSGADILFGGNNDDILNGNSGADVLRGGVGNDRLTGGSDAGDIFVYDAFDPGADTITDYQVGLDSFRLTGSLNYGDITITDSGATGQNTRIEIFATGIVITLLNVDHNDIDMNDFMFA